MVTAYDLTLPTRHEEPVEPWRHPIGDLGAPLAPAGIESREPPMETYDHLHTVLLLLEALEWLWRDRLDFFAAGNLTIYYSPRQLKSADFRGPDFFVVLGTHRDPPRKSWVVWDEGGKYPNVIVEVVSRTTEAVDRGLKKQIYQDVFRTPEYFLFDPETLALEGYRLLAGGYQRMDADAAGRLRSAELDLSLGIHGRELRFFLANGELVPTGIERGLKAETETRRAEIEAQRAELAEQRVQVLMAKLRELGVDPDTVK